MKINLLQYLKIERYSFHSAYKYIGAVQLAIETIKIKLPLEILKDRLNEN